MSTEEKVVAVIEQQQNDGEQDLANACTAIEMRASMVVVDSDKEYEEAGAFGVELREKMNDVTKFFAPMKKAAHDAHKQICDREKQMLAPLKSAESMLKTAIDKYVAKKEAERRAAEEAARRLAMQEYEAKMKAAVEAEKVGKEEEAEAAFQDAAAAESMSRQLTIESSAPTMKGVTTTTDYEIVSIEMKDVPNEINGVVIRPIDLAAVKRLIKASKGTIKIEGISYKEVKKTGFRR